MSTNIENTKITNCPNCGKHCPIDAVSCGRGEAFVEKLKNGEIDPSQIQQEQFNQEEHAHGEHHEHGHHGEHGHGHGHHGRHGHHGHEGEGRHWHHEGESGHDWHGHHGRPEAQEAANDAGKDESNEG